MRLIQELRCKIAVWQEANKSVRQIQRPFNLEFGINLVPTRRSIYAIHRKFMKTGSVHKDQEDQRADVRGKRLGLKRGIRIESRKIHTVRLAAVELEISRLSIQRMLRKNIKAFPYNLQTVPQT